jgi:hypothetical protein
VLRSGVFSTPIERVESMTRVVAAILFGAGAIWLAQPPPAQGDVGAAVSAPDPTPPKGVGTVPTAAPPLVSPLNIQLVDSTGPANILLPSAMTRDNWTLQVDLPKIDHIDLDHVTIDLLARGEKTGLSLLYAMRPPQSAPTVDVLFDKPMLSSSGRVMTVPLNIERVRVQPDDYRGSIRIDSPSFNAPIIVPFDLRVRDGPTWPLLVILLGIVIGRLVQANSNPIVQMKIRLTMRLAQLQSTINQVRWQGAYDELSRVRGTLTGQF